jgi:diguanylate cyclase (GGDEF)-like protein
VPYVLFGLLLALLPLSGTAAELRLDGGWRAADAREQAAAVARDDPRLQRFDPAQLQVFRGGEHGSWVLLWPARESWPPAPWVLEVMSPGLQTLSLYALASEPPRRARLNAPAADAWAGHGRIAFPVEVAPADSKPLRLHVDASGVIPSTMSFAVVPVVEHLRADARWLAFASACLAVMAAMAVIALFFALRLLDPTFVYYAVFVLAYAVILALQTGYAADPLGWHALAASPRVWGRLATALSVMFAILFLDRFADLRRHAPRVRRLLLGYAGVIAALSALGQLPVAGADALARALINPLLILGGPLLFGAAALAAWRGARYAHFFLLGWTPLLLVTVCGSLQLYGFMPTWTWSDDAALGAGALEALVLSLGLAERSLALRRDRDQARRLADIDALTGLYNRRAWSDRLLELKAEARQQRKPLSVLFLDLDRFKELNDRLGHEAGDAALRTLAGIMREELREQDMIGRYGGEEFVVALPGVDRQHAQHVAERIRQRLHDDAASDPARARQTVSVGVAMLDDHEDTATLLKRADAAMYAAKAAGRNRVVLADG